ncbi:MAG: DUF4080 domain-containing protein [Pseudomonadota bacterium]|nr:DUF4080 domain-containing protein [Pseudomonadota bacterium]
MDIVLATFNAKYIHASFGLRYLHANLGALRPRAALVELDAGMAPLDAVEALLAHAPRIVGFGVYVWNAELTLATVELLKALRPDVAVVLGGPEVSHEIDAQPLCALADVVVVGEGDVAFTQVCTRLLAGEPVDHVVRGGLPDLPTLRLPYDLYTDADLAHRVIYVEASRGCPFLCAFCLSALDKGVRRFEEDAFLEALGALHDRGLRNFKFVDRTFNLSIASCKRILGFFLERLDPALFVHFELIPDRLPTELKALIAAFPPGTLQFEIGIQTFDAEVAARIDRRHDPAQIEANLGWLRTHTGVHLHTDLIVGLPGESATQFGAGFDRLFALGPQEIQVGILKRLRGAPLAKLTEQWEMIYSPRPPYEVLQTGAVPFLEMQAMKRFARFWGLLANSGHYRHTLPLLLAGGSAFARFRALSDAFGARFGRSHAIASGRLVEAVYEHGVAAGIAPDTLGRALIDDLVNTGRLPIPDLLRPFATEEERKIRKARPAPREGHGRQEAHGSRG